MNTINPREAKFAATVNDVKELRLIGTAELEFWNRQLAGYPFRALDKNGWAELTISATELVWKGFRFHELTIFLTVAERDHPTKTAGAFLIHAFNSNRFFAFCERAFFSTPYYFGQIELQETVPFSIAAFSDDQKVLTAGMSETEREFNEEDEYWEGAVFLPHRRGEKYFIAKLSGQAKICPFDKSDRFELKRTEKYSVFDWLIDSGFTGREWRLRNNAFHAKSKTYSIYETGTSVRGDK